MPLKVGSMLLLVVGASPTRLASVGGFLTRSGSTLLAGGNPYRAGGMNAYWLGLDENEGGVHYPTHFRVTDGLTAIAGFLGPTLVRAHTVGISTGNALSFMPRLGVFNDSALDAADWAVAEAQRLGLRLIVPLTDNYKYFHGGKHDFTDPFGLPEAAFYTNESAIAAFESYVRARLAHVNPYTGLAASDEPAIAAWETGNELLAPADWTARIAAFIKSLDANHLVMDGTYGIVADHLNIADVDVLSDHFYPPDLKRFAAGVQAVAAAGKVYSVGEFGWSQGGPVDGLMAACLAAPACAQAAAWSFFPHADDFGFVQHNDGFTMHFPGWGFPSELTFVQASRNFSAAMMGRPMPPAYPTPATPTVTATSTGTLAWRGAAMAATYDVQTAAGEGGPWTTVSADPGPTDNDTPWKVPGDGAWVRLRGVGLDGAVGAWSAPSQVASGFTWSTDLADIISVTHWNPCYFNSTEPSLLDGLDTLARMGTRAIKLSLDDPLNNYPWNSDWSPGSWATVTALAQHPYYAAAFADPRYATYSLITYSQGPAVSNPCDGTGYDAAAAATDTAQFHELTTHLLATYPSKTFILDAWENDWWCRCGGYDPKTPIAPDVVAAYSRWLQARQTGVTAARVAMCEARGWAPSRCAADEGAAAAAAAAGGAVWHAAEVNIVLTSMTDGTPNLITLSIPHVALDMITYSSYDCMETRLFGACLDFIRSKHNRTRAAPTPALAIAEYGVAEMEAPGSVMPVVTNVIATALSDGAGTPGVRRAAIIFYWELFNNEAHAPFPSDRCNAQTGPCFNVTEQNGFWLVRPNMSTTPAWDYMQALIAGTEPPPPPPLPPTFTRYNDSDVVGNAGGATVPVNGTDPTACEAPCLADGACTAVIFWQGNCFLKYGGTPKADAGRVLLLLNVGSG